jgi:hypothetical protein
MTWMPLESEFAVGLFDLVVGGILGNAKQLVVVLSLGLLQLQLSLPQAMPYICSLHCSVNAA